MQVIALSKLPSITTTGNDYCMWGTYRRVVYATQALLDGHFSFAPAY